MRGARGSWLLRARIGWRPLRVRSLPSVSVTAMLLLAGCQEGVFFDPGPEVSAAIEISFGLAGEGRADTPGDAFDAADQLRVVVQSLLNEDIVLDETQGLPSRTGGDITTQFQTGYEGPAVVGVGLLFGSEFVFVGGTPAPVQLVNGQTTPVTVPLFSIISSIESPGGPVVVQGVGRQAQLTADAMFATGDIDPNAPLTWSSSSPNIQVQPNGLVTALAPGDAQATATWLPGLAQIPQLGITFQTVTGQVDITVGVPGTVRVDPSDVGIDPLAVATLQEALDIVDDGGTILVADGIQTIQNVVVNKPVTIEGEGTGGVLRGSTNVISFIDGPFTLKGLRLEQVGIAVDGVGASSGTVDQVTVAGMSGDGIRISGTTGTFSFTSTNVENAGGIALLVDGGAPTVSFGGSIDNTTGQSVQIQDLTGGSVRVDAPITDTGSGIVLIDNSSASLQFTGRLDLDTGPSKGLSGFNGGTLEVTGTGNTVTTMSGTAFELLSVDIGAAGVTFESVSSSGAQSGIILSQTGTAGSFAVTGDGSTLGSGGTITNSTASGIFIDRSDDASLNFMNVNGSGADGIEVKNSSGFTLTNSVVDGSGDQVFDFGVELSGVQGAIELETVLIQGSFTDNVFLSTGGTADVSIISSQLSGSRESALDINDFGANGDVTVKVINSDLIDNGENGIQAIAQGTGILRLLLDQNDVTGNMLTGVSGVAQGQGQLELSMNLETVENNRDGVIVGVYDGASAIVDIQDTDFFAHGNVPVHLFTQAGSTTQASLRATVGGNTMSGNLGPNGLSVLAQSSGRVILAAENNLVDHTGSLGAIQVTSGFLSSDQSRVDVTLKGNSVLAGASAPRGIEVTSLGNSSLCANIQSNLASGGDPGILLQQLGGAYLLERLNGGSGFITDQLAVEKHVMTENPSVAAVFASITSVQGVPNGTCTVP